MASESLKLDPDGTSLELWAPSVGYKVTDQRYPPPEHKVEYATSIDTEGGLPAEHHYENREIELKVLVHSGSTSTFMNNLKKLQQKVGLWQREGGVLQRVTATGSTIHFDVTNANIDIPADWTFIQKSHAEVTLSLEARPFGYGTETVSTPTTEASLPVVRHVLSSIGGDVPALGRAIITDESTNDQLSVMWGARSKNYSTDADAALFYEAETRTVQGGATARKSTAFDADWTAATASPAAPTSNNIIASTGLTTNYQPILSSASAGAVHLQHVGRYRMWARGFVPAGSTDIRMKLAWSEGDFTQWTENTEVTPPVSNAPFVVDLGQVNLKTVASGNQQWQARIF